MYCWIIQGKKYIKVWEKHLKWLIYLFKGIHTKRWETIVAMINKWLYLFSIICSALLLSTLYAAILKWSLKQNVSILSPKIQKYYFCTSQPRTCNSAPSAKSQLHLQGPFLHLQQTFIKSDFCLWHFILTTIVVRICFPSSAGFFLAK